MLSKLLEVKLGSSGQLFMPPIPIQRPRDQCRNLKKNMGVDLRLVLEKNQAMANIIGIWDWLMLLMGIGTYLF